MFGNSRRDFLVGGTSSREKHLDKFFKILSHEFFGNLHWRLVCSSFQLRKTRVLHFEGYFQDSFQKLFSFPSHIVTVHPLPHKLTVFSNKSSIFLYHLFINLQEKVWVLYFSQSISWFLPWFLGFCVFIWDLKIWCSNMDCVYFVAFDDWGLLVFKIFCLL